MNIYTKIIVFVLGYAIESAALYFLFDKAGERSYQALIPFVRYYTLFKIVWHPAYFYPYIILNILLKVLNYFIDILLSYNETSFALILFSLVYLAIGIVTLMLFILLQIKTAKAFSRSKGFTAGLIFLHTIFLYILAFSKKTVYVGPENEDEDENNS